MPEIDAKKIQSELETMVRQKLQINPKAVFKFNRYWSGSGNPWELRVSSGSVGHFTLISFPSDSDEVDIIFKAERILNDGDYLKGLLEAFRQQDEVLFQKIFEPPASSKVVPLPQEDESTDGPTEDTVLSFDEPAENDVSLSGYDDNDGDTQNLFYGELSSLDENPPQDEPDDPFKEVVETQKGEIFEQLSLFGDLSTALSSPEEVNAYLGFVDDLVEIVYLIRTGQLHLAIKKLVDLIIETAEIEGGWMIDKLIHDPRMQGLFKPSITSLSAEVYKASLQGEKSA